MLLPYAPVVSVTRVLFSLLPVQLVHLCFTSEVRVLQPFISINQYYEVKRLLTSLEKVIRQLFRLFSRDSLV